ncbi:hypothetical protein WICMUC_001858 [Wickerhamomyces mucosus]|uniref:Aldehyde dehydrogenase domain-containing protein n=1 Tax=Wickerhamomyces mucosus TaxID=1378264 RepID=A0A9P8TEY9_9ASCO|nr:hypothetical protein WICMUC_001858 [Wickerhamomyces mucosus]
MLRPIFNREEIFGPVAVDGKFKTNIDELITTANDSEFVLATRMHTKDVNRPIGCFTKTRTSYCFDQQLERFPPKCSIWRLHPTKNPVLVEKWPMGNEATFKNCTQIKCCQYKNP